MELQERYIKKAEWFAFRQLGENGAAMTAASAYYFEAANAVARLIAQ